MSATKTISKKLTTRSAAQELSVIEQELEVLNEKRDNLRSFLLSELKRQGVKSVKLENGTMYLRMVKTTLKADKEAFKWAEEHNSLKVDTAKAFKILKLTGESDKLPKGFTRSDTEFLTIKRANQINDHEQE